MGCLAMCIPPGDQVIVLGLLLDIVGIVLLFWVAPEKYPDPQSRAFFAIETDLRERWQKQQVRRRFLARSSLVCIVLGFTLQAFAVVYF